MNAAAWALAARRRVTAISCLVGAAWWTNGAAALRELDPARVDIGLHLDLTQFPFCQAPRALPKSAIYESEEYLEWTQPMSLGEKPFGEIRIGLTKALVRRELNRSVAPTLAAAIIALLIAVGTSMLYTEIFSASSALITSSVVTLLNFLPPSTPSEISKITRRRFRVRSCSNCAAANTASSGASRWATPRKTSVRSTPHSQPSC